MVAPFDDGTRFNVLAVADYDRARHAVVAVIYDEPSLVVELSFADGTRRRPALFTSAATGHGFAIIDLAKDVEQFELRLFDQTGRAVVAGSISV